MKVAAGGAGGRALDLRGRELLGDEVDDSRLGLEGSRAAQEGGDLGEDGMLA